MTIGIAGAGKVGAALGRALAEAGAPVVAVASRSMDHAQRAAQFIGCGSAVSFDELLCDLALVCVPDEELKEVAARIPAPLVALHTAGAYGPEVLEAARARGTHCGCFHPLQTFPSAEAGYRNLEGIWYAIDGDDEALRTAANLAATLKGHAIRIAGERRAVYHAAAATASNCLIALMDAAGEMLAAADIEDPRALGPLMRASLENALSFGTLEALTGPVRRGDALTVGRHLDALAGLPPSVRQVYTSASRHALQMAQFAGLGATEAASIESLLNNV